MALRRLFSGWLIAVAALARSMAQVLERAAADRSEPTPDPVPGRVMAALAARYPGAPDHWLALVAQRTARLADAGEAPLALTSHASAWPPSLPGAAGPLAPLMPTLADDVEAVTREPSRPVMPASDATATFQSDTVPSLAALQGRSSEVWRRPVAGQGRRPRPVFASVQPLPRVNLPSDDERAIEPRSHPHPELGERAPAGSSVDRPLLFPSSQDAVRDEIRSEATRIEPEAPMERPLASASSARPLSGAAMEREAANRPDLTRRVDAPAVPRSVSRPGFGVTSADTPSVGDAPTLAPPVHESHREIARPATTPFSRTRPTILNTPASDRPSASSHVERPAGRRSVFRAQAGLAAKPRAAPAHHRQIATRLAKSVADTTPVSSSGADYDLRPAAPHLDALQSRQAAFFSTPPRSGRTRTPPVVASFANDEAPRDPRARFAISHPSSPRDAAPVTAGASPDHRWPRFLPSVFTPPLVAEIPSPRLDQLAREQEEGRWSV